MNAQIVNDPSTLPVTIKIAKLKQFEKKGVKKTFLQNLLAAEGNPYGVIRESSFVINVDVLLRVSEDSQSLRSYSALLDRFRRKRYAMVMIKF